MFSRKNITFFKSGLEKNTSALGESLLFYLIDTTCLGSCTWDKRERKVTCLAEKFTCLRRPNGYFFGPANPSSLSHETQDSRLKKRENLTCKTFRIISARAQRANLHKVRDFPQAKVDSEINVRLLKRALIINCTYFQL